MKAIELHPAPHEVAVARVPAGIAVRAVREQPDGPLAAVLDLSPDQYLRWVQLPGGGFPWGAVWSSWYAPAGISRCRHSRDRAMWQRAARLVNAGGAGGHQDPAVLYVVHEQQVEHGKPVWAAVRIRELEAGQ